MCCLPARKMTQVDIGWGNLAAKNTRVGLSIGARFGHQLLVFILQHVGKVVHALHERGQALQVNGGYRDPLLQLRNNLIGRGRAVAENASHRGAPLEKIRPCGRICDALVFPDIALHDQLAQLRAVHIRIGHKIAEKGCIGPAQRGLGLFGSHSVVCVGLKCSHDLQLRHQARVHANDFELIDLGRLTALGKGPVQLIQIYILAQPGGQGRAAGIGTAGCRVAPTARPAHAMVGKNEHIFVCREICDGPLDKINQGLSIRHIDLAQILYHLRVDVVQVIVLGHEIAARASPVSIALEGARETVDLGNDPYALARADALRLVQVYKDILLQDLIVGILVKHDCPGLS